MDPKRTPQAERTSREPRTRVPSGCPGLRPQRLLSLGLRNEEALAGEDRIVRGRSLSGRAAIEHTYLSDLPDRLGAFDDRTRCQGVGGRGDRAVGTRIARRRRALGREREREVLDGRRLAAVVIVAIRDPDVELSLHLAVVVREVRSATYAT